MRPVRLVLEGFTSFTGLTEVDFTDADLFALCGPTGSGKSSLVDAMVFALYGRVPRLDGRVVAPLVALGRSEARVGFEFTVGGEPYHAVRVVRRTRTGASTKEAILERSGVVVAAGEREVAEAVESLLGLGYDHFTSCVVLPQGDFARLLHGTASERQDLLVSLLELGLYDRMREVARRRMQEATVDVTAADGVLRTLGSATPEARTEAAARLDRLRAIAVSATDAQAWLDALGAARDAATTRANEATDAAARLAEVRAPDGLADHSEALVSAREAVEALRDEAETLDRSIDEAEGKLGELPARGVLEAAAKAHRDRDLARAEHDELQAKLIAAGEALDAARLAAASAESVKAAAESDRAAVERQHLAHVLADSLSIGEPCPVCVQDVTTLPDLGAVDDLTAAEAAVLAADTGLGSARRRVARADRAHAAAEAAVAAITERIGELDAELADHPEPGAVADQLASVAALADDIARVRRAAKQARVGQAEARAHIESVEAADARERRRFDETRDALASLGPPVPDRRDLAADWQALVSWAVEERSHWVAAAEQAVAEATAAAAERAEVVDGLAVTARGEGVEPEGDDVLGPVRTAIGVGASRLDRLDHDLAECARQQRRRDDAERRAVLAKELARLLAANQFEKWVLDEALALLVDAATVRLRGLTDGAYSLALDAKGGFEVIDHRNADERRSARTLSGGETFLASLALALALSDQIGALATGGVARLEAMLIDEGFGSLDPDSLDTVATAMEELGSHGRVVGLISHVPDLAARMPVRYDVTAGPGGSTVTRSVA